MCLTFGGPDASHYRLWLSVDSRGVLIPTLVTVAGSPTVPPAATAR
jgi:hypothetical protein